MPKVVGSSPTIAVIRGLFMRMWMVNPKIMCRQHLLGEHVECHMFAGNLLRKRQITNYIQFNLLEPKSLISRHTQLVLEMINRGMNHNSPLPKFDMSYLPEDQLNYKVNSLLSLNELLKRCERCKALWRNWQTRGI